MHLTSHGDRGWIFNISMFTTVIVGWLKWRNGYSFEDLLINIVVIFILVYLGFGIVLHLLNKVGIWQALSASSSPNNGIPTQNPGLNELNSKGKVINLQGGGVTEFICHVDPALYNGVSNQVRSELKQKMGLD